MLIWHSQEDKTGLFYVVCWLLDKIAFAAVTVWNSLWDIGEGIVSFFSGGEGDNLYDRLDTDWARSITTIAVGIIVGVTLRKLLARQMNEHVALFLAIGYALGSTIVIWEIFNYFAPPPEVFIPSLPTLSELYTAAIDTGLLMLFAALAAGAAGYTLMKKFSINTDTKTTNVLAKIESPIRRIANVGLKLVVGVGVWVFLMMLILLVTANGQQTLAQFPA